MAGELKPLLRRPFSAVHALLLFLPAIEIGLAALVAGPLRAVFLPNQPYGELVVLLYNLVIAAAICLALGVWLVDPARLWFERFGVGLVLAIPIAVVNLAIAYAGCLLVMNR